MRETLGITSGLLAILFAVGAFSLLLLGTPMDSHASLERTSDAALEDADQMSSPLFEPAPLVSVATDLTPLLP